MEDAFKNLIIGFLLFSAFGMLILTATTEVGTEYGKNMTMINGALDLQKFNSSVSNIEEDAKALDTAFDKQNIWSTIAGVFVDGIFGIGIDMVDMILTPFDILSDIMQDVFLIPAWVSSVILGILILSIIFGIWNLVKIGN